MSLAFRGLATRAGSLRSAGACSRSVKWTLSQQRFASHGTSYEPPTGRLFNEPVLKAGEKRQKEDWENVYVYGFGGTCLFAVLVCVYRQDETIQSWALKEAKERQAAAGTTPTYTKQG